MFERPPCSKGPEVGQAVVEGYGTWRFGFVLVPAAEFGNDPSGPCERVLGMWIFLTCDLALDAGVERVDGVDLVLSKSKACRLVVAAITGLNELKARRAEAQSGSIDVDEAELAESLELPGADLSSMSGEELTVRVLPKQDDEFTCSSCFLVHHRSRLAREKNGQLICRDCA